MKSADGALVVLKDIRSLNVVLVHPQDADLVLLAVRPETLSLV